MIVLIDNYDSFTYNLVQYLGEIGADTQVYRNDKITVNEIAALKPDGIMISPGPCDPDQAGICLDVVKLADEEDIPLFGVCLGMQTIGQYYGGKVIRAPEPMHGKISNISHHTHAMFDCIDQRFDVTRYHSLIVDRETCPDVLEITAESDDGLIMGLAHKNKNITAVQFHPESIATQNGHDMLNNFLKSLN